MGYGIELREQFPAIRWLVEAQKTVWYPILFAVLCIISGSSGHEIYLPIILLLCTFVGFSAIFGDDNKVFLVPMLMIYYSLGMDNILANPGGVTDDSLLSSFDFSAFTVIIVYGVAVVAIFVARLIYDGSIAAVIKQRRPAAIGILVFDVALLANGAFNPNYTPMTLLYGAIMAISLTFFYFTASGMLHKTKDFIPYACQAMVCTAYVALVQFLIKAYRMYEIGMLFKVSSTGEILTLDRDNLALAWGLPTMIAAVFVLGIPAAMYLARNCKHGVLAYLSAIAFLIGTLLINTRSAILVGAIAFVLCSVICCLKNREHPQNAIFCRIMFTVVALGSVYAIARLVPLPEVMDEILSFLRFEGYSDSTRFKIWQEGIESFLQNPVFGSGFDTGSNITNNVFSSMYHCIFIQALGSMGVVGAVALVFHAVCIAIVFFKKISVNKSILMLIPLMIVGMSLVDNFFFYPNSQIFYCVFIVLSEYMIYQGDKDKNPSLPDIT